MTLVKDEPLGEKSVGPTHCKQEVLGKEGSHSLLIRLLVLFLIVVQGMKIKSV